ncbi:pentraxin-related protein b6 isoform X1 [Arctopsyche grandis]|uniref:pentraxin-related protein b6 isoform X1 n=1 Tax=Arctopsyche grandis TaxID=121162 RepID=UPI00406D9367
MKYRVDVPPLSQFTFCIWMMSQNLTYSHPILSYSKHERDRYIRARVTGGGRRLRTSILEQEVANVVVELEEQIWYHVCQSWDTNTGRWQAYLNGRLVGDGVNAALRGSVIPGGGEIVLGQEYTDFDKGLEDGIEGEIFGFNMILSSTTEEPNHKYYHKDSRETSHRDTKTDRQSLYVRLADLQSDKTANKQVHTTPFVQISPDHHEITEGTYETLTLHRDTPTKQIKLAQKNELENTLRPPTSGIPFWNVVNQAGREGRFKGEIESLALTNLPIYETPPALPTHDDSQKTTPSFEVLYSQKNFKGNQWYDQNDFFPGELLKTWKFKQTKRDKQRNNRRPNHRAKSKPINKDLYPYPSENVNVYVTQGDHSIFKRDTGEKNVEILNPSTVLFYPVSVQVYPRAESPDYPEHTEVEDRLKNHRPAAKQDEEESYEVLYSRLHYTGGTGKQTKPKNQPADKNLRHRVLPQSIRDKINDDREFVEPNKIRHVADDDKEPSSIYVFDDVNVNNHNVFNRWHKKYPEDEDARSRRVPKSAGRKLVELGYKKCLLDGGAPLDRDVANLISWTLTPVRVFGGAIIQNATPNCGRF